MNAPANPKVVRRATTPDDLQLNAAAEALLASLDPAVRTHELMAKFPRIVNRIAELWRRPVQLDKYFDELLVVDSTRQRNGFPLKILTELTELKEYYQRKAFPTAHGVWDQATGSDRTDS